MVSLESKDALLQLVRLGIGTSKDAKISKDIDWESVETLAEKQGVLGIVYDGIQKFKFESLESRASGKCNVESMPPQIAWLRIVGEVLQGYEQRYQLYKQAIAQLARFYNSKGYRMMLLKGLACGMDWPRPEHRPYGDIDIYLFGRQKEADKEMEAWFKVSSADVALARHSEQAPSTLALRNVQDSSFRIDNSHHHH